MSQVNLKRLISQKEVLGVIHALATGIKGPIGIQSADGQLLMGELSDNQQPQYPLEAAGEVIGWVWGHETAATLARLLSYLAEREVEKKALAKEVLDRYREFNLFYNFSQKLTTCLEVEEIGELIIAEMRRIISATNISVMLLNPTSKNLEVIAAFGRKSHTKMSLGSGVGIAGSVLQSGVAEIVNDVVRDPRFVAGASPISSLICAPLKTQEESLGVINISSEEPSQYNAQDLKVVTSISMLAAAAIENVLLHKNKLQEERIKSQLERYIPPQLVNAIISAKEGDISLSPGKKGIAILFSDIRSFTVKCEELPPEIIVGYLNEYFTQMVEVIFSHQGTVNKFVGDMIVAMFGAPAKLLDNEKQAIAAAIAMQLRLQSISVPWIRDNFLTGIGISSGEVVVGNIGSPQHLDYTAIGDEVNLASRLQGLAQGGQILVSRPVYEATQGLFTFRECGRVTVKGKRQSVDVFEVIY